MSHLALQAVHHLSFQPVAVTELADPALSDVATPNPPSCSCSSPFHAQLALWSPLSSLPSASCRGGTACSLRFRALFSGLRRHTYSLLLRGSRASSLISKRPERPPHLRTIPRSGTVFVTTKRKTTLILVPPLPDAGWYLKDGRRRSRYAYLEVHAVSIPLKLNHASCITFSCDTGPAIFIIFKWTALQKEFLELPADAGWWG